MLIHRIELANFKSFASAEIEMAPGLTAIVGENGAGKTAILDAIGLCLFDFGAGQLADVMRHGSADTKVVVEFTSGLDERRYLVTRSLHRARAKATGALTGTPLTSWEVRDVELDRIFERRADDARAFLAQHLGAQGFDRAADLFEHVVGVPQGRLTADFSDPPHARRQRFDRILRTDEFRRAVEGLLPLVHHFDRQYIAHTSSAAELQRQLERRPAVETELAGAEQEVSAIAKAQAAAQLDLARAQATVQEHDERARAAEIAAKTAELARAQVELVQQTAREALDRLREAEGATGVLAETRSDHDAFSEAQTELGRLGDTRTQQDTLRARLASTQGSETRAAFALQQAQQALHEAEGAVGSLDALTTAANAEASTSQYLRDLRTRRAVATATAERSTRAEQEVAAARQDVESGLRAIDDESEGLAAEVQRLEAEWSQASALQPMVEALASRRDALEEIRAQRSVVTAVMEADGEAAALLANAQTCPFFDSACRNLVDVPDVSLMFEQRASGHRDRLGQLEVGEAEAQAALLEAEDAAKRAGDLAARREALEAAQRAHVASLAAREALRPVETAASDGAMALEAASDAAPTGPVVEAAGRLIRALTSLAEVRDAATEAESLAGEIEVVAQLLTPHVGAGEACQRAQTLANDHDARRAVAQQADEAAAAATSARTEVEAELRALEPRLAKLHAAQQRLDRARPGHERFLQHERLAGESDTRSMRVKEVETQVREATAAAAAAEAEAGKLRALVDPEARAAAHAARDAAIARVTELDTRAESARLRAAERRVELAELEAIEQRLADERAGATRATELRARTEFMREVLRDAGPLVAEGLLADVSDVADEIFGEVLGDRAGCLRWTADYEIVLERGGHERRFAQLSGGEQMTAALAVRLALLRELLHLDIAFFDEPTQNLDDVRRGNLAEQILRVRGFEQLVVITHDDTFERVLDHVIHVRKVGSESMVESA